MATIKVKRRPESKGRCKLAYNKAYNAEINPSYKDSYIIGNNVYLCKWFAPVTDQQPKPKPIVKTDSETGKLKVERDWSKPVAFPSGHIARRGEVVFMQEHGDVYIGTKGKVVSWYNHMCTVEIDESLRVHVSSYKLAPLNPTDHPEHPDFGKAKPAANWQKDIPFKFEFIESKPQPEPFDIREVIAKYIRQHGTQLTAIELIGHLTIDAQWQSSEK